MCYAKCSGLFGHVGFNWRFLVELAGSCLGGCDEEVYKVVDRALYMRKKRLDCNIHLPVAFKFEYLSVELSFLIIFADASDVSVASVGY